MKHTPGPWIIDDESFTDLDGSETIVIFTPEGRGYGRVAMVYAEHGRDSELWPNANLIATAPDLLEALEYLVLDLENSGEILETDSKRIEFMENAIAKARGGSR